MDTAELHSRLTGLAPSLARHPGLLDSASHDPLVELLVEFAANQLTGPALSLAQQLVRDDEEAREIYRELAPPAAAVTLPDLAAAFTQALHEFYLGLAQPRLLAAAGDQGIREKILQWGNIDCVLRLAKRPDGQFNAEFVIPANSVADPATLAELEIRIVDRPQPLVFEPRRSGNLVATQVLPPAIENEAKQIVIVSRLEPS